MLSVWTHPWLSRRPHLGACVCRPRPQPLQKAAAWRQLQSALASAVSAASPGYPLWRLSSQAGGLLLELG
jgi:hypothetical protein